MTRQRGQVLIILAVIVVFVFVAGLLAICTPGEDDHSLGRMQLVHHERCDPDYDDCGPPPDDDRDGGKQTCFMACYITVPGLPGQDQPPPRERASLFPPTPDKIIGGIQVMGDAGIKLGSTIAELVIDYVVTVFRFIV